jgi:hypothetical protein
MRKIILVLPLIFSFHFFFGQSIQNIASQHVFVYCNKDGSLLNANGKNMFIAFHQNMSTTLLIGTSLANAIDNGPMDHGGWYANELLLGVTWSSNNKTTKIYTQLNGTNHLKSMDGGLILKNISSF